MIIKKRKKKRGDLEREKWKLGRRGMVGTVKPWERKKRRWRRERERERECLCVVWEVVFKSAGRV
jgi:hypothetical protein